MSFINRDFSPPSKDKKDGRQKRHFNNIIPTFVRPAATGF